MVNRFWGIKPYCSIGTIRKVGLVRDENKKEEWCDEKPSCTVLHCTALYCTVLQLQWTATETIVKTLCYNEIFCETMDGCITLLAYLCNLVRIVLILSRNVNSFFLLEGFRKS